MDIGRTLPAGLTRDLLAEVLSYKTLYAALCKLVQDAVIELDAGANVVGWNLAAETLTGHSAQSALGKPLAELLPGADASVLATLPQDGAPHDVRLSFSGLDGARLAVRGHALALKQGDTLEGWLIACEASRGADEIEQLKNEFVSTVSHELRTPLAAIKAYSSTLNANPTLEPAQRGEYLQIIEQQADRLARLVDDLLLVTRVEAGHMLKRRVRVPLDSVLDRALEQLAYDRDAYAIERDTQGIRLSGDPDRLTDIFSHLIDNAVKYMPGGGTIRIAAQERDGSSLVTVRDGGVGIEAEHLPLIFDRFYRVDSDSVPAAGGSGLGLFLVHSLVRAHGGTVDVRSEPGAGSAFTVTLPVRE